HRDADPADDRTPAADGSAALQPQQVGCREQDRAAHHGREYDDEGNRYVIAGNAAVEHHDGSENERGNAAQAEGSETGHERLRGDHTYADYDQGESRVIDR